MTHQEINRQVWHCAEQVVSRVCGLATPPGQLLLADAAPPQQSRTQRRPQQPAASEPQAPQGRNGSGGGVCVVTYPLLSAQPQLLSLLQPQRTAGASERPAAAGSRFAATPDDVPAVDHSGGPVSGAAQHLEHLRHRSGGHNDNDMMSWPKVKGVRSISSGQAAKAAGGITVGPPQRDEETQAVWAPPQDAGMQSDLCVFRDAATAVADELPQGCATVAAAAANTDADDGRGDSEPGSQPPAFASTMQAHVPDGSPHSSAPAGEGDDSAKQPAASSADSTLSPPSLQLWAVGSEEAHAAGSGDPDAHSPRQHGTQSGAVYVAAARAVQRRPPPPPLPAWEPPKVLADPVALSVERYAGLLCQCQARR